MQGGAPEAPVRIRKLPALLFLNHSAPRMRFGYMNFIIDRE